MSKLGQPLTEKELTVLRGIAAGLTNAAIGRQHGRPESTIADRATNLYRKLGAVNAPHAVDIAHEQGILGTPPPTIDADRIAQAIGDPGSIVGRKHGPSWGKGNDGYAETEETVTRWSTRAVLAVLNGTDGAA